MTDDREDGAYPVAKFYTEPTDADLEALERIAARRAQIEAERRGSRTRSFLLATLDEMEETLCLQGCRSRVVRDGWQTLDRFRSFGRKEERDEN